MIRLGIIGCGNMAKSHVAHFAQLAERMRVTAVVDVEEERAALAATALGGAIIATDYRSILSDVDAVLLVLPHHLHHPVAMECLATGKHVLVEKPLANSERECLEMIDAAERAGRVLMTAYCLRYHPLVTRMKEVLDARTYGECFQLSLWTEQYTHYPDGHWARKADTLGGGQLFSHGCHYIDLMLWFLGHPVEGFHLGTNYGTPWMEWEGTSHVAIKFETGALGYHFGTWGNRGTRLAYSFHAHCTDGMVEAQLSHGRLIAHHGGAEHVLMESQTSKHPEMEMAHFLDCIDNGTTPQTDARSSLQSLRVIWRLYDAERQHTMANLHGLGLDEYRR